MLSESEFNRLFPNRNEEGDAEYLIYEYSHLLEAADEYPDFASEGTEEIRRREVVQLLAYISRTAIIL